MQNITYPATMYTQAGGHFAFEIIVSKEKLCIQKVYTLMYIYILCIMYVYSIQNTATYHR